MAQTSEEDCGDFGRGSSGEIAGGWATLSNKIALLAATSGIEWESLLRMSPWRLILLQHADKRRRALFKLDVLNALLASQSDKFIDKINRELDETGKIL